MRIREGHKVEADEREVREETEEVKRWRRRGRKANRRRGSR